MTTGTNSKKKLQTQNDAVGSLDDYQKVQELAEKGGHEEALEYIQGYLSSSPDDAEALNDAGAILYCMNRSEQAVEYFLKARNFQPDAPEIIWNLAETYLATGKATEAMELFDDMGRLGILNADLLNRTAEVLLNEGNLDDALEMLHRSQELLPGQEILQPMIEVICHKMVENSGE